MADRLRDAVTSADPLAAFSESTRDWFRETFAAPTRAQAQGWQAIAAGEHTLIQAPTGAGKTLAAFLWCSIGCSPSAAPAEPQATLRVLYVSPLKALAHDIERNLRRRWRASDAPPSAEGTALPDIAVAPAHRRHAGRRTAALSRDAAGHPDHHARVAVPAAHRRRPRDPAQRGAGSSSTRSTRSPAPSGARTWRCRWSGSSTSSTGHCNVSGCRRPSAHSKRSPLPRRHRADRDGPNRRRRRAQEAGPRSRRAARGHDPSGEELPRGAPGGRRRPRRRRPIWPSIHPRLLELIQAIAPRSSSSTAAAWPSGSPHASTSSPARSWSRAHHGSSPASSGWQIEEALKAGHAARRWWPPLSWSSASTWARSTWSSRSSRRRRWPPGCSASGGPATRSARRRPARSSRSTAATCWRRRWSCAGCWTARSRPPASRATRWTCWPSRSWPSARSASGRWTSCTRWSRALQPSATCRASSWRACWTCSPADTHPTSSRISTARGLGSHGRHHHQPRRRARGGGHLRRHDPRSRPVRRLPAGERWQGRRVGELDEEMVYEVARRRDVPAGRQLVADRGDQAATR